MGRFIPSQHPYDELDHRIYNFYRAPRPRFTKPPTFAAVARHFGVDRHRVEDLCSTYYMNVGAKGGFTRRLQVLLHHIHEMEQEAKYQKRQAEKLNDK
jgi:hypothetical protein